MPPPKSRGRHDKAGDLSLIPECRLLSKRPEMLKRVQHDVLRSIDYGSLGSGPSFRKSVGSAALGSGSPFRELVGSTAARSLYFTPLCESREGLGVSSDALVGEDAQPGVVVQSAINVPKSKLQ